MIVRDATWTDVLGYADECGLGGQARKRWSAEHKIPARWRATIASRAIEHGQHVPNEFFHINKRLRPQVAPLKP